MSSDRPTVTRTYECRGCFAVYRTVSTPGRPEVRPPRVCTACGNDLFEVEATPELAPGPTFLGAWLVLFVLLLTAALLALTCRGCG